MRKKINTNLVADGHLIAFNMVWGLKRRQQLLLNRNFCRRILGCILALYFVYSLIVGQLGSVPLRKKRKWC